MDADDFNNNHLFPEFVDDEVKDDEVEYEEIEEDEIEDDEVIVDEVKDGGVKDDEGEVEESEVKPKSEDDLDVNFYDFDDKPFEDIPELADFCEDIDDKLTDAQMDDLFRQSIREMLFGFGDVRNPKEETIDELVRMAQYQIHCWVKDAMETTRRDKPDLMAIYYLARGQKNEALFKKAQDLLKHYGDVQDVLKVMSPDYKPNF
uniref:Uncharacterized protein n=1 Tax=Panagrolaimus sp. JU765 TaxID=591449 RepID=A0AC34PZ19_9BILA